MNETIKNVALCGLILCGVSSVKAASAVSEARESGGGRASAGRAGARARKRAISDDIRAACDALEDKKGKALYRACQELAAVICTPGHKEDDDDYMMNALSGGDRWNPEVDSLSLSEFSGIRHQDIIPFWGTFSSKDPENYPTQRCIYTRFHLIQICADMPKMIDTFINDLSGRRKQLATLHKKMTKGCKTGKKKSCLFCNKVKSAWKQPEAIDIVRRALIEVSADDSHASLYYTYLVQCCKVLCPEDSTVDPFAVFLKKSSQIRKLMELYDAIMNRLTLKEDKLFSPAHFRAFCDNALGVSAYGAALKLGWAKKPEK